jgi:NADH-quinone oxidoreductase subunit E
VGNDETTEAAEGQKSITLEHLECNAACDYAPVMMVNWEFMDNMTPESAVQLVDDLREGKEVHSTRGPRVVTWREAERVLAGFPDGLADDGPAAGPASLVGLGIARERGWTAPTADAAGGSPEVAQEPREERAAAADAASRPSEAAVVEKQSGSDETAAEKEEGK